MIKKIIVLITLLIIILINCQYIDRYASYEDKDLLSKLDLSNDWIRSEGLTLDQTAGSKPSGVSKIYYLSMMNLVNYDSFEESSGALDFGNWQASADVPDIYEVTTDTSMYGSKYLHLKLNRTSEAQYFYHIFNSDPTKDYVFRFDYIDVSDGNIQLSFGIDTSDDKRFSFKSTAGLSVGRVDVTAYQASANYQIRFGYANQAQNPETFEAYIDNVALFFKNSNSLQKRLYLSDSDAVKFNDGTGVKFYEGIYLLQMYAKAGETNKITMKLGSKYKTFTLTSGWKKIEVTAQIMKEDDHIVIDIIPAVFQESSRIPGGVYITSPKLYYLY